MPAILIEKKVYGTRRVTTSVVYPELGRLGPEEGSVGDVSMKKCGKMDAGSKKAPILI